MKKEIKDIIGQFVKEYYSNHYGCILTGSHVEGKQNNYSDIDVLIFITNRNKVFNETLCYHSLKIQSIIIPVQNIEEVLWVDYITSKGAFIDMLSKGIIISNTGKFAGNLIAHAKDLKILGPPELKENDIYLFRVKLTSLLDDLKGSNDLSEMHITISNLLEGVTKFKLTVSRFWCGDGKYRMRGINNNCSAFGNELINSMRSFYNNSDKSGLINLVEKTLELHGGSVSYYSKNEFKRKVSENYLVLEIEPEKTGSINLNKMLKTLSSFLAALNSGNIYYYYFLHKPVGKNKVENNIYYIIHADQQYLNEFLINRLDLLFSSNLQNIRIKFPFQFDPIYKFSSQANYDKILPFFLAINNLKKQEKDVLDENFQIRTSVIIFKLFKKKFFKNNEKFIEFLGYLYKSWIVYSIDGDDARTTKILLKRKKELILSFENSYRFIEEELKVIFHSSTSKITNEIEAFLDVFIQCDDLDNIPLFKDYFLEEKRCKEWVLYKEIAFRTLSILMLNHQQMAYIPFLILKLQESEHKLSPLQAR